MSFPVDIEKVKTLNPEGSITVAITYDDEEIAIELQSLIEKQLNIVFTSSVLNNRTVTTECKNWGTVNILERLARTAKMNIYEKKFGKI